jgi:hypothetical protein
MADINARPLDIISRLAADVKDVVMPGVGEPQAYTRVTRTPIRWGNAGDAYGKYYPDDKRILLDADKLPQQNANPEYMSNIIRHESVHALVPPGSDSAKAIQGYFDANPAIAGVGRIDLSRIDPNAGKSNAGLAQEAPAYAVQGYRLGMPDDIVAQYKTLMPDDVRRKYAQLLRTEQK